MPLTNCSDMKKIVLSFMLLLVRVCAVAEVRIVHQTVNAMTSPIGISHLNPRFGWAFEADYERGIMQEAYSISIYEANHLESPVFSTGMTEGDACVDVCIPDLQLAPCTSYCWKVTARLNDGTVVESPFACFETAIDEEEMKKVHCSGRPSRLTMSLLPPKSTRRHWVSTTSISMVSEWDMSREERRCMTS